jgi:hypothetical protein
MRISVVDQDACFATAGAATAGMAGIATIVGAVRISDTSGATSSAGRPRRRAKNAPTSSNSE